MLPSLLFWLSSKIPHIEKIYNPPPPRIAADATHLLPPGTAEKASSHKQRRLSRSHNLIGLQHLDLFRVTDYTVLLLMGYLIIIAIVTPRTPLYQALLSSSTRSLLAPASGSP